MPTVSFKESGTGPAMVFLHGFCDTHELWSEFITPFAASFRVLMPDLPGFGKSEILASHFTIDEVGDSIALWLSEKQIDSCLVVGHSLGGYIALSLLERHPEILSGIVLFHSTPMADRPERKAVRDKVIDFVRQNGVAPYVDTLVPGLYANPSDRSVEATRKRMMGTSAEALIGYAEAMRDRPDRTWVLESSTLPVMVIGGIKDSLISIDDLRRVAQNAPNCELFEVPEAAHMGIFEAKTHCQTAISRFAARVWTT